MAGIRLYHVRLVTAGSGSGGYGEIGLDEVRAAGSLSIGEGCVLVHITINLIGAIKL